MKAKSSMTRREVLDLYFMDARSKLIDIAAFLDRVDRAGGDADFRLREFKKALQCLDAGKPARAEKVLLSLSDHSTAPIPKATIKGATGAYERPAKKR